ncbi:peptidase associated/transthyretin-like domain-containing protein [Tuwongella immobilis]|uniref:Carboxypeptidase regulatory-like domain-containing protein n=1 Tax=Tuwongella immobilis TaxID=692036 RepID=A0A6C2YQU5_9BACT|nr:hypothetical protein [Tuwongella immobilis]VIP04018.1 Uncharacterized protein OS=Pirellula staleyi (strain ATCC 27377 / DSM 6068 / ICPB 4128) GN=Psta_0604 PE=4 SV=1 [Tuwongella immobilis]VTS05403.1 Uncharacterized protein OS=Pirellula staleyi (strain ATCC 27377 / DSM 6068 / ICPB 4128) GN=Psta_0604 PE=4 SV=1 [Tuwongella immobilis]
MNAVASRRWRRWTATLGMLSMLGMSACSSSDASAELVPVQGVVLVDQKPAADVQVTLRPIGNQPDAPTASGKTDAQGRFKLTTRTTDDGAAAGEYQVAVTRFVLPKGRITGDAEVTPRNTLPPRYANPETSGVRVTVRPGSTDLPPIEVRSR